MVEFCAKANEDRHISAHIGQNISYFLHSRLSWTKSDACVMTRIVNVCLQKCFIVADFLPLLYICLVGQWWRKCLRLRVIN